MLSSEATVSAKRKEFYERLLQKNSAPLWETLAELVPPKPNPSCVPALWPYDDLRPLLMEAGQLITAKEAERRVMILENPGLRGRSQITNSLYAGLQLVQPGEIAPSHRHSASALRFVIESDGAYTAVDGERTTMRPGDFILTPSWTFHDHGNPSDVPAIWLDGLDIPIVNFLDTGFSEHYPEETQSVMRQEGDSLARYGANLLPLDYARTSLSAPVFTYPYSRSRDALEQLYRNSPIHSCHGIKMQYVNPASGGYPLTTIGAFLQYLPHGFRGQAYRSSDATIYCVAEGSGRSKIGESIFDWKKNDIFAIPSWCFVSHEADSDGVLFSFSDRPVQKALGLWREQT
jgi:gentisate 1,2-dioxygenase